jgi:PIN domain nuclease of toxin-antitoxin system
MRALLDTHVWLWMLSEPERLSAKVQEILADPATELSLSVASAWEVAIKHARGKLPLPGSVEMLVEVSIGRFGLTLHPIQLSHAVAAARLPTHHNDPFDRLLIAQAALERMTLVTADKMLSLYGGQTLWAE